ncbi:MAG: DNA-processing protein DprA [Oscillibacter sp.]|nr:DNA-processing protein DprA [Oscillibacter sp.]
MRSALKYWLWLTRLPGLSNQSRLSLLRRFGTPENVYLAEEPEFALVEGLDRRQAALLSNRSLDAAERVLERCQKLNLHLVTLQDANYPDRLRNIYDPPCLLYVKGRLPPLDEEIVLSVVGTRKCTPYGVACAESISYGLATGGAIVASGLARGIDSAAIRGALLGGGVTIGVLGNGLDVVYPRENAGLYDDVAASGALVSEYPPGAEPLPGNFPVRNRILSGIAVGALVVEAPLRSGALITASRALEQGRDVFAVPGPIGAFASQGCNRLIQEGAALVADANDIFEAYAARFPDKLRQSKEIPVILPEPVAEEPPVRKAKAAPEPDAPPASPALPVVSVADGDVTPEQAAILRLMSAEDPVQADDLIDLSGLPTRQVLADLTMLEIGGYVKQYPGKRYTRLAEVREDGTNE